MNFSDSKYYNSDLEDFYRRIFEYIPHNRITFH
jgi:hypothetical protein